MQSSNPRRSTRLAAKVTVVVAALSVFAASGCQSPAAGGGGDADFPSKPFTITVLGGPGGGMDQLSRSVQLALTESDLVKGNIQVVNVPGAGGMLGLNQFVTQNKNDPYQLCSVSAVTLGAEKTSDIKVTVEGDTTPIAELASEYLTIVTKKDSKYQTMQDLVAALKADPKSVNIVGSVSGSLEQVLTALMAQSIGIDPTAVKYVAYENASEQVTAVLSGDADVSVMGISEILPQVQEGSVKALVVSSPQRVEGYDAPTFAEAGMSPDLATANWRGILGPKGISTEDRDKIVGLLDEMRKTDEWREILKAKQWSDTFKGGDEFKTYVDSESVRIGKALQALGLTDG